MSSLIFLSFALIIIFVVSIFSVGFASSNEDTTPPRTPQDLQVASRNGGIDVSWKENGEWDVFSYMLYVRTGDEKEDPNPIPTGRTNYYSLNDLTPGATYYISLAAKDNAGNMSEQTPEIGITADSTSEERDYSIAAWMPLIDLEDSQNEFLDNLDLFDFISPFELRLEADGSITKVGEIFTDELKEKARFASVKVLPTITNNFDKDDVGTNLLNNDEATENHINNILNLVDENDVDGIDLDYEGLKPEVKDKFTNFIQNLSDKMHAKGKILSVTVQAKKSDDNNWRGPGAMDYAALADPVDHFRIMTYDYSRLDTPPGPIAPIGWFKEVLSYAKQYIPDEKIIAGIPNYGYKWCMDGEGCENTGLVHDGVQNIVNQYNPVVEWNDDNQSPWFLYVDDQGHTSVINFENHESIRAKMEAVRELEIGGISIWRLGSQDQDNFNVMRETVGKENNTPSSVKVKPGNRQIEVSWQKNSNDRLHGFRIKIKTKDEEDPNPESVGSEQVFDLVDKDNYIIPNLENDKAYYISIIPLVWSEHGSSGYIENLDDARLVLATPSDLLYPAAIDDLKAESVDTTAIDVSFTSTGDDYYSGMVAKYEIMYSEQPFTQDSLDKAEAYSYAPDPAEPEESQMWQLRGLTPGVKYYIAVRSFDEKGNVSDISNVISAETVDNIPPKIPEAPEVIKGDKSLFIKWKESPEKDVAGYKIFWKQEKSFYEYIEVDAETTTYILNDLENHYNYHIAISAFDDKGNESPKSEITIMVPRSSDMFDRINGTLRIASEKIKANASVFTRRLLTQGAIPYLVMFSVLILNVFIYQSIKREVQKKINRSLEKAIKVDNSKKVKIQEVKKKKYVMKF